LYQVEGLRRKKRIKRDIFHLPPFLGTCFRNLGCKQIYSRSIKPGGGGARCPVLAGAGFSNIPEKNENAVFIIKNPRNSNECFLKVTLRSLKMKNIMNNPLFTNVSKKIDDYSLKYLNDLFKFRFIF